MFFFQQKRRQEAQDRVLSHVEENALLQSLLHNRPCGNVEHETLNESTAANFQNGGVLAHQFFELLVEVSAYLGNVIQQMLFVDDREKFQCDAASKWASSKGCAVLPGGNSGCEVLFRQERAERHPGGERLRYGEDVRNYAETLEGEDFAGPTQSALNFIEDERCVM